MDTYSVMIVTREGFNILPGRVCFADQAMQEAAKVIPKGVRFTVDGPGPVHYMGLPEMFVASTEFCNYEGLQVFTGRA